MKRLAKAVLILTAFLLLGGAFAAGFWLIRQALPTSLAPNPLVGRLALVGPDGNIYTARPDGSDVMALTRDALPVTEDTSPQETQVYQWPAWSPDGDSLAFLATHTLAEGEEQSLFVTTADGSQKTVAYQTTESTPIFFTWSPDDRYISILTQEERDLALRIIEPEAGSGSEILVDRGSPFYFAWSPDSSRLVLHIAGSWIDSPFARLALFDLDGDEPQPITGFPANFLTPDWSPDGEHLLYAVREEGDTAALVLADPSGQEETEVSLFRGAVSFQWAPRGERIAYVVTPDPELGTFGPIQIWEENESKVLTQDNVFAFFWSPDGKKLAYMVPELGPRQGAQRALRVGLYVADVESGRTQWLASFTPSQDLLPILASFDQYAKAISFWSPDSQRFVYTGQGDVGGVGVWVVDVKTGLRTMVATGSLAVWSPK